MSCPANEGSTEAEVSMRKGANLLMMVGNKEVVEFLHISRNSLEIFRAYLGYQIIKRRANKNCYT